MSIDSLLASLLKRLPELEWQLSKFGPVFSFKLFPPGLFRCYPKDDIDAYSKEIKDDIKILSQQENSQASHYLAQKINQKINVLVTFCQQQANQKIPLTNNDFSINKLTTRQQWLQNLEGQIILLRHQKEALVNRLSQSKSLGGEVVLKLNAELGQLQKQLTLAEEAYTKALN
ncbi:hypothetical protein [Legionella gresilensis]|uniref:hypothetical protein n=1 Tax=Legionella gresilensis TaxID=91823 RepID=UPI001040ED15|nr:hypothetical protein [Legionella gresilensis]